MLKLKKAIIFTSEEKTLENLNKVIDVLRDKSWDYMQKTIFLNGKDYIGIYLTRDNDYDFLEQSEAGNHKLITLKDFLQKYDKPKQPWYLSKENFPCVMFTKVGDVPTFIDGYDEKEDKFWRGVYPYPRENLRLPNSKKELLKFYIKV